MRYNAISVHDNNLATIRGDLLDLPDYELNFALCCFIHEVSKKNGDCYPAESLYDIVIYLQLYMCMYGRELCFLEDDPFI